MNSLYIKYNDYYLPSTFQKGCLSPVLLQLCRTKVSGIFQILKNASETLGVRLTVPSAAQTHAHVRRE